MVLSLTCVPSVSCRLAADESAPRAKRSVVGVVSNCRVVSYAPGSLRPGGIGPLALRPCCEWSGTDALHGSMHSEPPVVDAASVP